MYNFWISLIWESSRRGHPLAILPKSMLKNSLSPDFQAESPNSMNQSDSVREGNVECEAIFIKTWKIITLNPSEITLFESILCTWQFVLSHTRNWQYLRPLKNWNELWKSQTADKRIQYWNTDFTCNPHLILVRVSNYVW